MLSNSIDGLSSRMDEMNKLIDETNRLIDETNRRIDRVYLALLGMGATQVAMMIAYVVRG